MQIFNLLPVQPMSSWSITAVLPYIFKTDISTGVCCASVTTLSTMFSERNIVLNLVTHRSDKNSHKNSHLQQCFHTKILQLHGRQWSCEGHLPTTTAEQKAITKVLHFMHNDGNEKSGVQGCPAQRL